MNQLGPDEAADAAVNEGQDATVQQADPNKNALEPGWDQPKQQEEGPPPEEA